MATTRSPAMDTAINRFALLVFVLIVPLGVVKGSQDIRLWTAAAPCPWTRSYLGNHFARAKAGSELQVKFALTRVTADWIPYVRTLARTAGVFGAALADAAANEATTINHINAQMLATNGIKAPGAARAAFVARAGAPKQPAAYLDGCVQYLAGLPSTTAEERSTPNAGGGAAAKGSYQCSVFCAALVAHSQAGKIAPKTRSCSVAYGKNAAGKQRIQVGVSGATAALHSDATQYDARVLPPTITVNGVDVRVFARLAEIATAVAGTIPYQIDPAAAVDDAAYPSRAAWQGGGLLTYDKYLRPGYEYAFRHAAIAANNVGICSEDKCIADLTANI